MVDALVNYKNGSGPSDPFSEIFRYYEHPAQYAQVSKGARIYRRLARSALALSLAFVVSEVAMGGFKNVQIPNLKYRVQKSAPPLPKSPEYLGHQAALDSMYTHKEGNRRMPPKPAIKVFGAMAVNLQLDPATGNYEYHYIPDPALVTLPDGSLVAVGKANTNSQISVLVAPFTVCGSQPSPTIEVSPLGLGVNGYADGRIGSEFTSLVLPDGCKNKYSISS